MHFVDDIDFVFAGGRCILGVFQYFADVVDACVGGGVDFEQVDIASGIDLGAAFAHAARFAVLRVFAVEALARMRAMVVCLRRAYRSAGRRGAACPSSRRFARL